MSVMNKLFGDRKEWKAMEARAHALPSDYQAVYEEIKSYMWKLTTGDGSQTVKALETVITEFEAGAGRNLRVRDVTGADVAAYCDARLQAHGVASYSDKWRASLNDEVASKLAE